MTVSHRIQEKMASASWIRKMFEEGEALKRRLGADAVFDFSLGNPIAEPPPEFQAALEAVLAESGTAAGAGSHRYMPNAGFPDVRAAVAEHLGRETGQPFVPERIVMCVGAGGGLNVTLKALLDPFDEVVIFAPYFVEYLFYVDNHGGVVKVCDTAPDFDLDLSALEEVLGPKTKAVILNSPNNPTGRMYPAETLAGLGALLSAASARRESGPIYLITDEPYKRIVFDGKSAPDVFAAYPHTILVTSHSKDLSIPGERIGHIAVGPECESAAALAGAMTFTNRILGFVNAPAIMQKVAAHLQGVSVDPMIYQRKRDIIVPALKEIGYEVVDPEGAFYIFPKTPIDDDVAFTRRLQRENILVVPGSGFGRPGHFRLSYCVDDAVLEGALEGFARAFRNPHDS